MGRGEVFAISDCLVETISNTCDIFGVDHIWLQSDGAFVYPRLDSTALSVGMLWAT